MLEFLYNKIFVNIVVGRVNTTVYIETVSKKNLISSVEESFKTTSLDSNIESFIAKNIVESPYYYISILDTANTQGVFAKCDTKSITSNINRENFSLKCIKNEWSCYTPKSELEILKNSWSSIGLDFIFSPFLILSNFFKDKIDAKMSLYILEEESHISLMIFFAF